MKKKKVFGLLLGLALALSVVLPGTLMTSAVAETTGAGSAPSFYERVMASTSVESAEAILEEATEQEAASLTEQEIKAMKAHLDSLEPKPLPEAVVEESKDKPIQSEIIYPTVSYTDVAPFGSPVVGGAN